MIVGIDLGTTHSLIGAWTEDGPRLFPNALGELLTPSVVAVDGDRILVGAAARERAALKPETAAASFKRYMGTGRTVMLGRRAFRAEELSALVLRQLVDDAEAALGQRATEAVISVPAYFSDAQRKATKAAGELTGLKVERLINEPTAAALAYGLQERKDESTFLVFDLGGGTFDVSILEAFDGVMQVHATAGDNYLGGDDFLEAIVLAFCADHGLRPSALTAPEHALLSQRLERAKRDLSRSGQIDLSVRLRDQDLAWTLTEDRFATLVEPLVQRLRQPIERALRDARLSIDRLDEVVLVGGASRMPLVSRLVTRMLGRLPLRHVSPDEAIALGAAVAAGMKGRHESLEEIVLTDVAPYTLGVEVSRELDGRRTSGHFQPLIERNSTVPISRMERFFPVEEFQTQLDLVIFQGESPLVANNVRLGELKVHLAKRSRDENAIDVRFTYDVNGVLQIEATVVATGHRHELILEKSPGTLSPEEIRKRLGELAALKVHPRENQANIALIARLERLYAEYLALRPQLQHFLAAFLAAVESQDTARIDREREELGDVLDQLESGA